MKTPVKQSYLVTFKAGTQKEICCGPAVVALGDGVRGYVPLDKHVECQNRDNIPACAIVALRAEARKKTEKRISILRSKASILLRQADDLERRIK